ncbi:hypothetical protein BY458DRAFT_522994 [Sporodiniella umbellata]|nr:hypothetical protein BY458DRAFT_522994 [Sporodiniella umbellata]
MNSYTEVTHTIEKTIQKHSEELRDISLKIHENPELGNREFKAFELLTNYLERFGFRVTRGVVSLKTAFIAEYTNGKPGRRIGLCSEYDALPGVGHACGHNLIAIQGVACALAMKALLDRNLISGSVTLFGTPAEESTCSKVRFVNQGEIEKRVDFAMMLHPHKNDCVFFESLALDQAEIEFFGKASHAGMAPWNGINALDALMQGFDNIGLLRQQLPSTCSVHGIIKKGGNSANVIPDYTSAQFYVRASTRDLVSETKTKVENCFKAASLATGCQVKIAWSKEGQLDDLFNNEVFGRRYMEYMDKKGVKVLEHVREGASTDMGNVSYVVPSLHPIFGIDTTASNHTIDFTYATKTVEAHHRTMCAAICLSMTAADASLDSSFFDKAVRSFKKGKQY